MYSIEITNMDLRQLARSGQCFRMKPLMEEGLEAHKGEATLKDRGIWRIPAGNRYVEVLQREGNFLFSCTEEEFHKLWHPYFDMDTDYQAVKEAVDREDAYLGAAVAYGGGVRILRQDLWEMIVTFLISQNNNILRIGRCVEALCRQFGERRTGTGLEIGPDGSVRETGRDYYSFPAAQRLSERGPEGLSGLGLGYRDRYLWAIASKCSGREGREWLKCLKAADYGTAHGMLMSELGIGRKVADCICLYGLYHIEAFPMDTHVKQIVKTYYPRGFPLERYRGFAGILQQYMFYYKTEGGLK